MEQEIWKDIPGYEGLYQVSNLGNVKSLGKVFTNKNGKILKYKAIFLKKCDNGYGYYTVYLCHNMTRINFYIHRLVAQVFIPNPENKEQVNHINGIKTDNRIENLEWVTRKENLKHSIDTGLRKLKKVIQFNDNGNIINRFLSTADASKFIGCTTSNIYACLNGRTRYAKNFKWKYE